MDVLVVGTGTMGTGIAHVFALNSHRVFLYHPNIDNANKGMELIRKNLKRQYDKGSITEEIFQKSLNMIVVTDQICDASHVELAIEAVSENIQIKKDIFNQLDQLINNEAIFATNTSSLSITEMAMATKRPHKFIGMHFFNPAPVMQLVEIIKGISTDVETVSKIQTLSETLGKKSVLVEEAPGFIVNRILIPMINEAVAILSEGVASPKDIDSAMKLGANHPIGPLELADLIGIDICLNIMEILHKEMGVDKYTPHPLMKKMVRANQLGRKTKCGFYQY